MQIQNVLYINYLPAIFFDKLHFELSQVPSFSCHCGIQNKKTKIGLKGNNLITILIY